MYVCQLVATSRHHCYYENATMPSLCIDVDLHAAVNNIKQLSVNTGREQWAPLQCCRATKHFVMLSKLKKNLGLLVKRPIFLTDFNQMRSLSTDFHNSPDYQIS